MVGRLRAGFGLVILCMPLGCSGSSAGAGDSAPAPLIPDENVVAGVAALEERLVSASSDREIVIELPADAAYQGELISGPCTVRAAIDFRGGEKTRLVVPCMAEYRGREVKIVCDTAVLRGTLTGGRVRLFGREYGMQGNEILLEGQATAAGRLAGTVLEAGGAEEEWDVVEGRWEVVADAQ